MELFISSRDSLLSTFRLPIIGLAPQIISHFRPAYFTFIIIFSLLFFSLSLFSLGRRKLQPVDCTFSFQRFDFINTLNFYSSYFKVDYLFVIFSNFSHFFEFLIGIHPPPTFSPHISLPISLHNVSSSKRRFQAICFRLLGPS